MMNVEGDAGTNDRPEIAGEDVGAKAALVFVAASLVLGSEVARMKVVFPIVRVPDGLRVYALLLTVIAGEPGSSVLLPRMKPLLPE